MADFLKCGYTADYFYNLPIERFVIFQEFIDVKQRQEEEMIKKAIKRNH